MPFKIVRNDITNMSADAIVNTANPKPVIGTGVDYGIHKKAGAKLLKARKKIGDIEVGHAAITRAYGLDAKYVIHAVGPVWIDGEHDEEELLRQCYRDALDLALKKRCASIAFPLISTGNYGFPKALALQIATQEFSNFLVEHDMRITLAVFGDEAFELSEKLYYSVKSYIDAHYIEEKIIDEYGAAGVGRRHLEKAGSKPSLTCNRPRRFHSNEIEEDNEAVYGTSLLSALPEEIVNEETDLESVLATLDAGFSETLLHLIDLSGKSDSEIYKKANFDRKMFSKIRNNKYYKPKKTTAVAFAVALELDLDETKDFIGRAGYALSHCSKFDVIIEYFISNKNYNIFEINETLFKFDQPLIGG